MNAFLVVVVFITTPFGDSTKTLLFPWESMESCAEYLNHPAQIVSIPHGQVRLGCMPRTEKNEEKPS